MARYRAVYDKQGKAFEYQDGILTWVRPDLAPPGQTAKGPTVLGDIPDFISPIDGSLVSGRAGLRDHCARHNVVPTAELSGLPPKPFVQHDYSPEYREQTKRTIAEVMNSRTYPRK
jgi:hypothetical protein